MSLTCPVFKIVQGRFGLNDEKRREKMKKGLILIIGLICMAGLFTASKSHAAADLFGAHCWTGESTGVFIKLQFTRNGPLRVYNVNGTVTRVSGLSSLAYGTGLLDETANTVKVAYTLVATGAGTSASTVTMELAPDTLNGTKVIVPPGLTENVNLVSCK